MAVLLMVRPLDNGTHPAILLTVALVGVTSLLSGPPHFPFLCQNNRRKSRDCGSMSGLRPRLRTAIANRSMSPRPKRGCARCATAPCRPHMCTLRPSSWWVGRGWAQREESRAPGLSFRLSLASANHFCEHRHAVGIRCFQYVVSLDGHLGPSSRKRMDGWVGRPSNG